jgi:hypothetical protein
MHDAAIALEVFGHEPSACWQVSETHAFADAAQVVFREAGIAFHFVSSPHVLVSPAL